MKEALVTFLLISTLCTTTFGQTHIEEIKQSFTGYFNEIEQKNSKNVLEYIYPKVFDHFPKDRMLEAMSKKSDTTTIVEIDSASIIKISNIFEMNSIKYALIKYCFRITMTFVEDKNQPGNHLKENHASTNFRYEMFKKSYGRKNVKYDSVNNIFYIIVSKEMYAISDPAYVGWKFIEKTDNMQPLLEKILPKKVLKKL